jgi:hypothetical protein
MIDLVGPQTTSSRQLQDAADKIYPPGFFRGVFPATMEPPWQGLEAKCKAYHRDLLVALGWSNSSVTFLIAIVFAWVESHRESTSSVVSRPSARQATAVSIRPIAVAASDDENADHTLACRTGPAACLRRVCRRGRRVDQYHGVPHDADQLHRPHQCVLCCSHRASSRLLSLLSLCPQS